MNKQLCGTIAGPVKSRTMVFWQVIYPDGYSTDTLHSKYLDVSQELMEIAQVYNETMDRLRGARSPDWDKDDERMWVRENSPEVAKSMGYQINKVMR